ncbi:glycosyltransferase [Vibrio sp. T187]|uniref:glycosyltransferase n=1 Tax=Vibrio TaxID=662 RepID=UPI0010C9A553|nr:MULTISPECIES: glycosyltransferase [Vibrio]MBW3695785.1 glycosyltransferase [Vibrio sp. T187]
MNQDKSKVVELLSSSNEHFDLTDNAHQEKLYLLADKLLALKGIETAELKELASEPSTPLEFSLAVKLVESKRNLLKLKKACDIAVVFAMWGEQNRLRPKSSANLNGEDSLRAKVRQLNWVTEGTLVNWRLYPVDDGCPNQSADVAREMAATLPDDQLQNICVLELTQAIPTDIGPLKNLAHADDSRKGGAIILGCEEALQQGADAVVYTDADNSVHLGQLGLLVTPFVEDNQQVVLGNRKHKDSILVKQEERWGVGIKTLRHMQRMIGAQIFDQGIKDTQAAFKLYGREVLKEILRKPTVYDFSFDTDWIFAAMEINQPITTVPFAFIDSAAESASVVQGPMTTWYVLLDGLVKSAKARKAEYSEEMAEVFTTQIKSHRDLELIIDAVPPELALANDHELGKSDVMSPQSVNNWIMTAKSLDAQQRPA